MLSTKHTNFTKKNSGILYPRINYDIDRLNTLNSLKDKNNSTLTNNRIQSSKISNSRPFSSTRPFTSKSKQSLLALNSYNYKELNL